MDSASSRKRSRNESEEDTAYRTNDRMLEPVCSPPYRAGEWMDIPYTVHRGMYRYEGVVSVPEKLMEKTPMIGKLIGHGGFVVKRCGKLANAFVVVAGSNPYFPADSVRGIESGPLRAVILANYRADVIECQQLIVEHLEECWSVVLAKDERSSSRRSICSTGEASRADSVSSGSSYDGGKQRKRSRWNEDTDDSHDARSSSVSSGLEPQACSDGRHAAEKSNSARKCDDLEQRLQAEMAVHRFACSVDDYARRLAHGIPDLKLNLPNTLEYAAIFRTTKRVLYGLQRMTSIASDLACSVPNLQCRFND